MHIRLQFKNLKLLIQSGMFGVVGKVGLVHLLVHTGVLVVGIQNISMLISKTKKQLRTFQHLVKMLHLEVPSSGLWIKQE